MTRSFRASAIALMLLGAIPMTGCRTLGLKTRRMFGSSKQSAKAMAGGGDIVARADNPDKGLLPAPVQPAARAGSGPAPAGGLAPRPKTGVLLVGKYNQGRIHVEIQNFTQREIVVGPKNLAIAAAGGKQIFPFQDYAPGLAITRLRPGDSVAGYLGVSQLQPLNAVGGPIRPGPETLNEARLLFQHPDVGMVVTPLRPGEPEDGLGRTPAAGAAPGGAP